MQEASNEKILQWKCNNLFWVPVKGVRGSEFCRHFKLTFVHVPFPYSLLGSVFIVLTPRVFSRDRLPVVTGERELQFLTLPELWCLPNAASWWGLSTPTVRRHGRQETASSRRESSWGNPEMNTSKLGRRGLHRYLLGLLLTVIAGGLLW